MKKLLLTLSLACLAGGASAHAMLEQAAPPVGSTVPAAPSVLTLQFSEAVEPKFSGVDLTLMDGTPVASSTIGDLRDPATLDVKLAAPLPPGTYKVSWHVVSVDTHKTHGGYLFTVKP